MATGFRFAAKTQDGWAQMGDRLGPDGDVELVATVPAKGLLRLLRDGRVVSEVQGEELVHRTSTPAVYRVETQFRGRPWIYSNPITLLSPTA